MFFTNDESWLEVDNITVRNGILTKAYIEVTFNELRSLILENDLESQQLYVISDYQNVWRLPANSEKYNRPIIIRAASSNSLYPEGNLFDDCKITIQYDPFYIENVKCSDGSTIKTRGKIIWMKDSNGNEANFDFLDYEDHEGNPLTTLHYTVSNIEDDGSFDISTKSVFPVNSKNNKITVHNLQRTVLKKDDSTGQSTGEFDDTNTCVIDFKIKDSIDLESEITESAIEALPTMIMHDNTIDCYGLSTAETCLNFYNNTLKNVGKVLFSSDCIDSTLTDVYSTTENITSLDGYVLNEMHFPESIVSTTINGCVKSVINGSLNKSSFDVITNSTINGDIYNSTFLDITDCTFHASFNKVNFQNITDCVINAGSLSDINCRSDVLSVAVSSEKYPILYDTSKVKDVYFLNGEFKVIESAASGFLQGMIVMHTGEYPIPEGWAICDGQEHTYNGVTTKTPNLVNRFIKAVTNTADVKAVDNYTNNELVLTTDYLPKHSHPHETHTHTFSGEADISAFNESIRKTAIVSVENGTEGDSGDIVSSTVNKINLSGTTGSTESKEKAWQYKDTPTAIKIEPNYYSLIFIMKL